MLHCTYLDARHTFQASIALSYPHACLCWVALLLTEATVCRAQSEETAPPRQLMESKRIAKALMAHVLADHAALHILFDLLDAFTMRTRVSLAFLREFFSSTISQAFSLQDKQEVRCIATALLCQES